jgi:hypothetical protein
MLSSLAALLSCLFRSTLMQTPIIELASNSVLFIHTIHAHTKSLKFVVIEVSSVSPVVCALFGACYVMRM